MSAIRLLNLTKSYGSFPVLRGITLDIEPGELFGFLGPNGAGKTTTIKIMTGLLLPSGGRAVLAGHDVVTDPYEVKRRIGYVPDRPYLYDKLTGTEFLEFVGHLHRLDADEVRERTAPLIERFDLAPWADELIEAYSHGMRQKLAMVAALAHDPDVFIIDEPTVGLDPRSTSRMKTLLTEIAQGGRTVFLSTHTLEIAEALCSRVAIIQRGEIVALGTVDELRRQARGERSLEKIFLRVTEREGAEEQPTPA